VARVEPRGDELEAGMRALNIEVPRDLLERWIEWFAPSVQPFLVDTDLAASLGMQPDRTGLTAELRDTFEIYNLPSNLFWVWLSEPDFLRFPRHQRAALVRAQRTLGREIVPSVTSWARLLGDTVRGQADGRRFVWWPSLLRGYEEQVLTNYVEQGRRPSRHDEVKEETWDVAANVLSEARSLAGKFAVTSGPNCFGTVMAAFGVAGADSVWMQREPFEEWLSDTTRPGGQDDDPGTVFVWRSPDGLAQHAAVTLGAGWALHKPSQGWMSPTKTLTVTDVKHSSREKGRRLQRYTPKT
jgi:hypothetical protein